MKLAVSQMKEGENRYHFDSGKDSWLGQVLTHIKGDGIETDGPLAVDLNITRLDPDYYVRGDLKYQVKQPCSRCAEVVDSPIAHHFELAFSHVASPRRGAVEKPTQQDDAEGDASDLIIFHGNELEIEPVIEEQVILSVPYLSLCRQDCKGICQTCGKNLNEGVCQCSEKHLDSPFSILKNMKEGV